MVTGQISVFILGVNFHQKVNQKRCILIGKGKTKINFKVVSSNAPKLLDFVRIYGSHLWHLDATSTIDGL